MKFYLLALGLLVTQISYAGGVCCDTGPGCATCPEKEQLEVYCPGRISARFPNVAVSPGQTISVNGQVETKEAIQPTKFTLTADSHGQRVASFFHPFCSRTLFEQGSTRWLYVTNCEGDIQRTACVVR